MPRPTSREPLSEYRKKRDFAKTQEPSGEPGGAQQREGELRFIIQKHAASHLHFDLRLELGGVMKSWAVPKGPSLDPEVRRLAMEVEDHPVEYNDFEGTIPKGEYGGGTVMLWDRGTYSPDEVRPGESHEKAVQRGYTAGKLSFSFHGERLRGSFALVRTGSEPGGVRSRWLLLKHRDEDATPERDITAEVITSVESGRTMKEIAAGKGGERVWHSNRGADAESAGEEALTTPPEVPVPDLSSLLPMLARTGSEPPRGKGWNFEPKYDGIRILALVTTTGAALITRNGHDKTRQFPEVAEALVELAESLDTSMVLDGELVALENGRIVRFEKLQGRMHLTDMSKVRREAAERPAALVAFDVLIWGQRVLLDRPWGERRQVLEELLEGIPSERVRLGESATDAGALQERAKQEGWEGIMAKRVESRYRPGQRSPDWVKIKMENQQELVVGGWTEPRKSRSHLGAILLGYYDDAGDLIYAGHTGTGFNQQSLEQIFRQLKKLERKTPPFKQRPKTNEPAHWTTPKVVVQVKFNEWTREGKLRQPVFLGIREDRDPRDIRREPVAGEAADDGDPNNPSAEPVAPAAAARPPRVKAARAPKQSPSAVEFSQEELDTPAARRIREVGARGGGPLRLEKGVSLGITSLDKVFYPSTGHTKGDLLTYYARMGEHIVPWMKDRPLVLKRFPNGVEGESFYQQAAPDSVPAGVRVETLTIEEKQQRRLVGGNLATLLYTVQLGAISFDPWHSRVTDLESADYTILDLDPGPGVDFQDVVQVARWVKDEMDQLELHGGLKTSGSSGLHIYLPLPKGTPLDAATLVAQIVATRVAKRHPELATVERMTRNRPHGTIYVDYLQNILGKTVAGVYAARARTAPTVSTPLRWEELTDDLDLHDFTVDTVPARVRSIGDLWAPAMAKPNSLQKLLEAGRKG